MRVGTFTCERQDCPKSEKPCPLCGMPDADPLSLNLLRMYQRCNERHALPVLGGVLDQPEAIMREFDIIDEVVIAVKKERAEKAERDAELARLRGFRG